MLDTFYKDSTKSWIFVFIYIPFIVHKFMWQYRCNYKNGFYYGFLKMTNSFEIWYWDNREGFCWVLETLFWKIDLDFLEYFSRIFFSDFSVNKSFISWYLLNKCSDLYVYAYTFIAALFNQISLLISLSCDLFKFVSLNNC